ncbi:MAG: hypothetical protein HY234_05820 [Acidobacteria bacterium]|nr:hypothetical protein [Acidobacteriota bacterium]MBI3662553.1 hypothetical protein [Acidobacteriota bacterium]
MKVVRTVLAGLVVLFALNAGVAAQEKMKAAMEPKPNVPVKILVVLTEYDGEKKISSMPYTLSALASEDSGGKYYARLRMGLKVPIMTSSKEGQSQLQYQDVGTDIDARVEPLSDNRFQLELLVRRSSVHTLEGANKEVAWGMGEGSGRPILRAFSTSFDFVVREGQSTQTTVATDPISGHVLKVDVTLNVVK